MLPAASGSEIGNSAAGELCALKWPELVARLAAARDLRAEFARSGDQTFASFDPDGAAHLALHGDKPAIESERGVNLDGLVNGKVAGGIVEPAFDDDDPGHRGIR